MVSVFFSSVSWRVFRKKNPSCKGKGKQTCACVATRGFKTGVAIRFWGQLDSILRDLFLLSSPSGSFNGNRDNPQSCGFAFDFRVHVGCWGSSSRGGGDSYSRGNVLVVSMWEQWGHGNIVSGKNDLLIIMG